MTPELKSKITDADKFELGDIDDDIIQRELKSCGDCAVTWNYRQMQTAQLIREIKKLTAATLEGKMNARRKKKPFPKCD